MENNINTPNQPDAFSEMIRQKLENHTMPVDVESWSAIEKGLKSKRKKIVWWMWIPIGSAAVLALLFTLRPMIETQKYSSKNDTKTIEHPIINRNVINENTMKEISIAKPKQTEKKLVIRKIEKTKNELESSNVKQQTRRQVTSSKNEIAISQTETTQISEILKDTIVEINTKGHYNELTNNEDVKQIEMTKKESVGSKDPKHILTTNLIDDKIDDKNDDKNDDKKSKTKSKNNWLLAAAFGSGGSGGSSLLGSSDIFSDADPEKLVDVATSFTTILAPNDFTSIVNSPPISFGLVVRKNLDEVWSVESGLVYTYLLTTYDNQNMQRSDAKLHLHYVGIPVSLVARVWKNQKWDVYLAAGAMLEKGIQSNYIQNQYVGNQTYTTTVKSKINGLQESLNGSIGANYKLQSKLGIYFEPKISYYLDNNQPMSARTEQPIVIGFIAGLRFEL